MVIFANFNILSCYPSTPASCRRYPYAYVFSLIMVSCNSAINPIIYFALSEQYRKAFARLLHLKASGDRESSLGTSSLKRFSQRQRLSSVANVSQEVLQRTK